MQTTDLFAQFNGIANRVFNQAYDSVKSMLCFKQDPQWVTTHQAIHHNYFDGSDMLSMQINLNNDEAQELQGNFQEALTTATQIALTEAGFQYYGEETSIHTTKTQINDFATVITAKVYNDQPFAWATIGGSDTSIMLQVQFYWQ